MGRGHPGHRTRLAAYSFGLSPMTGRFDLARGHGVEAVAMTMQPIAITGANGAIGRRVAERLAARQVRQRLVVRDPARVPFLPGADVHVAAGYDDADGMRDALAGVRTLLFVSGHERPERVGEHLCAIDAAVAAGVEHIVYLSFLGASRDATFTLARDHDATEQAIRSHDVAHTFLRDSLYLDLLPAMVGADGLLRGPAGQGRLAGVARDDVADVAAAVLTGTGHEGATYDLTGPEALTLDEAAAIMSEHSGKSIGFYDEGIHEAYASRADPSVSEFLVDAWVSTYLAIRNGEFDVRSDAVQRLTGHAPVGLRTVLDRLPGVLDHVAEGTGYDEPSRRAS